MDMALVYPHIPRLRGPSVRSDPLAQFTDEVPRHKHEGKHGIVYVSLAS
jgi:hypothetical protein